MDTNMIIAQFNPEEYSQFITRWSMRLIWEYIGLA